MVITPKARQKLSHCITTRFYYPEEREKDFQTRLAIFKAMTLPRFKLNKVDILVKCHERHNDIFKELGCIPVNVKKGKEGGINPSGFYTDYIDYKDLINCPKYDIQSSVDSDDLISPKYCDIVKHEVFKAGLDKSVYVQFQPMIFNAENLSIKRTKTLYNEQRGSAFYSLYQPNKEDYIFIGKKGHFFFSSLAQKKCFINEGHCWIGLFGDNDSSHEGL